MFVIRRLHRHQHHRTLDPVRRGSVRALFVIRSNPGVLPLGELLRLSTPTELITSSEARTIA
jgi:hypothetical protein